MKKFEKYIQAGVTTTFRYFQFETFTTVEDASRAIKEAGWEPATKEQLQNFVMLNPNEKRRFRIVGLGSAILLPGHPKKVPYISRRDNEDGVWFNLCWEEWGKDCRFLAVQVSRSSL